MIHALLDSTQVISLVQLDGTPFEVCAEALARHDRGKNLLTVELRAFLRAENHDHIGEVSKPGWLPEPQTVTEHVGAEEAHAMANDVLSSWRHKVENCLPKL
ncbi:hypothetical protein [Prosthecobacter sp.]|uniref:hypothetical protein n=1 Tax=Prosthecobacter sp. TaxID=1965333 RepID=UPI00378364A8